MSRSIYSSALALALFVPSAAQAQPGRSDNQAGKLTFLDPIIYYNMSIVPVSTSQAGPFVRYTLLEEGVAKGHLQVRELGGRSAEAQVSAVEIKNRGPLKAFVLSGEMILGGKQDRILSSDTVIPNDGKWHSVEVFCVEQGRWQGRKMKFKGGGALAHAQLRKAALSGSQGNVWSEVQRKNATHDTESNTQTYRRTVQKPQLRTKIKKYRDEIARKLPDTQLVGFVFAVNGKTRVADLFSNPLLFSDLQEKLLSAYILEALEDQVDKNAPKFSKRKAKGFYEKSKAAPSTSSKKSGSSRNYKKDSKTSIGTQAVDEDTGESVKESYFAK